MELYFKIIKYQARDILRSKWLIIYLLFFFLLTEGLYWLDGNGSKVLLSLTNVVLIIIPLVSLSYGLMYFYNSREYIEMMLSQPVKRSILYSGMYFGLAIPLNIAFIIGILAPFLINGSDDGRQFMLFSTLAFSGSILTFLFIAISFWISMVFNDKIKGFGFDLFLWLFFSIIFDGFILVLTYIFSDFPVEKPLIGITMFNPVSLARIFIMLQFDVAALMGFTGAVFQSFFGSSTGILISLAALILWTISPFALGMKLFMKKDF